MSVIDQLSASPISLDRLTELYTSGAIGIGDALFLENGNVPDPTAEADENLLRFTNISQSLGSTALPKPGEAIIF